MNSLQTQISELNNKIDRLYETIARLDERVCKLNRSEQSVVENSYWESFPVASTPSTLSLNDSKYQLTHKDVLIDDSSSTNKVNSDSERNLSADIQIRRLTAQLTAAYNRIAALEEQILTYRIHS